MAGDSIEPFPFDRRSFPFIETHEVWLAVVDVRALAVDLRPGKLKGTDVDMVILRLVSHGGKDDFSCMIPLDILAKLRNEFDIVLKEVEERNP